LIDGTHFIPQESEGVLAGFSAFRTDMQYDGLSEGSYGRIWAGLESLAESSHQVGMDDNLIFSIAKAHYAWNQKKQAR